MMKGHRGNNQYNAEICDFIRSGICPAQLLKAVLDELISSVFLFY